MTPIRIIALVLIIAGIVGLAYGGFSFTKEKHDVKLGPVELAVTEKEHVNVPVWAGVAAVGIGVVLLLSKKN